MLDWTFELNDNPMSAIKHGAFSFPAFSGLGSNVNWRASVCVEAVPGSALLAYGKVTVK